MRRGAPPSALRLRCSKHDFLEGKLTEQECCEVDETNTQLLSRPSEMRLQLKL